MAGRLGSEPACSLGQKGQGDVVLECLCVSHVGPWLQCGAQRTVTSRFQAGHRGNSCDPSSLEAGELFMSSTQGVLGQGGLHSDSGTLSEF